MENNGNREQLKQRTMETMNNTERHINRYVVLSHIIHFILIIVRAHPIAILSYTDHDFRRFSLLVIFL